jgi:hypothetical protein
LIIDHCNSGIPGLTFITVSFFIVTVPGFAPFGFETYFAMVQETAVTPPPFALLCQAAMAAAS